MKVTVTSERPDEYIGKKGLVKWQVIACQDVAPSGYVLKGGEEEHRRAGGVVARRESLVGPLRRHALQVDLLRY